MVLCCCLLILCCVIGCCCACEFWVGWLAAYCISVLFVSLGLCFVLLGNFLLVVFGCVDLLIVLLCYVVPRWVWCLAVCFFLWLVMCIGKVTFSGYFCVLSLLVIPVVGLVSCVFTEFALCLYWLGFGTDCCVLVTEVCLVFLVWFCWYDVVLFVGCDIGGVLLLRFWFVLCIVWILGGCYVWLFDGLFVGIGLRLLGFVLCC